MGIPVLPICCDGGPCAAVGSPPLGAGPADASLLGGFMAAAKSGLPSCLSLAATSVGRTPNHGALVVDTLFVIVVYVAVGCVGVSNMR